MSIETDGFVILERLISGRDLEAVRTIHTNICEFEKNSSRSYSNGSLRIGDLIAKHRCFESLATHPTLLESVRKILGDDCILSGFQSNRIDPGGGTYHWHVDYPYHTFKPRSDRYELLSIQTLLMLDDFTPDNGATAYMPNSFLSPEKPENLQIDKPHPDQRLFCAPAGSLVINLGSLWHTPTPNRDTRSRTLLIGQYVSKYVSPQEDMKHQYRKIHNPSPELTKLVDYYTPYRNKYGVNRDIEWSEWHKMVQRFDRVVRPIRNKIRLKRQSRYERGLDA